MSFLIELHMRVPTMRGDFHVITVGQKMKWNEKERIIWNGLKNIHHDVRAYYAPGHEIFKNKKIEANWNELPAPADQKK